jgi:hypothetical protein
MAVARNNEATTHCNPHAAGSQAIPNFRLSNVAWH